MGIDGVMLSSVRGRVIVLGLAAASVAFVLLLRCSGNVGSLGGSDDGLSSVVAKPGTPQLLTADGRSQQIIRLNPPQRTPNSVRLVILSDTHTHHSELNVPDGDILIHAGDYALARTSAGRVREKRAFDEW